MVRVQPEPVVKAAATGPEKEVVDFINTFSERTATLTRDGRPKDAATLARDQEAMANMLSDDYVFINPNGQALNKVQMLREIKNSLSFRGFSQLDHTIKIHENTAILTGTFGMKGVLNGRATTGRFQGVQTLVKQPSGQWIALFGAVTKVAAPATAK